MGKDIAGSRTYDAERYVRRFQSKSKKGAGKTVKKGPAACSCSCTGDDKYVLTVSSDVLAHAVELLLPADAEPSDNYFDLTPGETRRIVVCSRTQLTDQNVTLRSAYDWFVTRPEAINS